MAVADDKPLPVAPRFQRPCSSEPVFPVGVVAVELFGWHGGPSLLALLRASACLATLTASSMIFGEVVKIEDIGTAPLEHEHG